MKIDTDWLDAHLPDLRIIDCTVYIVFDPHLELTYEIASGRADFERGHIPGAQFADVVTELSDPANPVPLMAPNVAQFTEVMRRLGVSNASRTVLYSGQNAYRRRGYGGCCAFSVSTDCGAQRRLAEMAARSSAERERASKTASAIALHRP